MTPWPVEEPLGSPSPPAWTLRLGGPACGWPGFGGVGLPFAPELGPEAMLLRVVAGSGIGDEGLKHLHVLTALKELDLTGTKITEAGGAALQKALPKCKIRWGAAGK